MRRLTTLLLAVLLVMTVALPAGATTHSDGQRFFAAGLKGKNEVPPVDSNGFGLSLLAVNRAETALGFVLIVGNLENVIQAHIHCGPADANGPVVAFLFGPADPPVTDNGLLSHGVIRDADVIARPDSDVCPGGVADFDDLIAQMRAGNAYVNVHTQAFPSGEIRGQIR